MICPLCHSSDNSLFDQDKERSFFQCKACSLVFVPRNELVSPVSEKARYDSHENDESDEGYRKYITGIADSIRSFLSPGMKGLDFGSGRTKMMAESLKPFDVESYDIFYHPEKNVLTQKYDFIIMSEVIEHLRGPRTDLEELKKILTPGGLLFVKTKLLPEKNFSSWFYKRDITHVQFFSKESFAELSRIYGFTDAESIGSDLYLFRNNF